MSVAQTILSQLGGGRFLTMTGAKNLVGGEDSLSFRLPQTLTKGRINFVTIRLTPRDDYTVTFNRLNVRAKKPEDVLKPVAVRKEVYCDNLQEIFTEETGLFTSFR